MKIFTILVFLLFLPILISFAQPTQLPTTRNPKKATVLKNDNALILTLTGLIEGFYNGNVMVPDTVTVELHDPASVSSIIESQKGVLSSGGIGTFNFTTATNDSPYFIVVKHRNALETWSSTPHVFTSSTLSYDFTSAITQAYGNNLVLKGGKYCFFSGDINHDGQVTFTDIIPVDNDNRNFVTGFTTTDITGDNQVSFSDIIIVDNNNNNFVSKFVPSSCPATVLYEGQTYHTVLIGTHYWLKENLNVGTIINADQEQTNNGTIEKYCLGNDTANCTIYGGFYQWNEAMNYVATEGTRGICPSEWHIPTKTELNELDIAVSGDANALKEIGQGTGEGIGTNASGFSSLITGYRLPSGYFWETDISSNFWSSTIYDASYSYYMFIYAYSKSIFQDINDINYGFSVRCIRD